MTGGVRGVALYEMTEPYLKAQAPGWGREGLKASMRGDTVNSVFRGDARDRLICPLKTKVPLRQSQ